VHVFATTGDMRLIPLLVDGAKSYTPMSPAERDALITEATEWPTIFPLMEHAKG
jgi:hypothetical protein